MNNIYCTIVGLLVLAVIVSGNDNSEKLSKRILVECTGDVDQTVKIAERLNFKFISTIKDNDATLLILESRHEAVKVMLILYDLIEILYQFQKHI